MDLKWRQDNSNKLIISITEQGQMKEFLLAESLVGYLTAHKLVHVYIKLNGSDEHNTLINFAGIRPISGEIKNFGGKRLTEEAQQQYLQDKCAIARGETFASKWLTPRGWSTEKHYFSLEPLHSETVVPKTACPFCGKMIAEHSKFCGYCGKNLSAQPQKPCANKECKKMIKDNARFCPYCGIKQQ